MGYQEINVNASFLVQEMTWINQIITLQLIGEEKDINVTELHEQLMAIQPPEVTGKSFYEQFITEHNLSFIERFIIGLTAVPHLQPTLLAPLIGKHLDYGCVYDKENRIVIPTLQTALYILALNIYDLRFQIESLFEQGSRFSNLGVVSLSATPNNRPSLSAELVLSDDFKSAITTGNYSRPQFSAKFPAQLLTTEQDWDDLVLPTIVLQQLQRITDWMQYGEQLMSDYQLQKIIKKGYRALFYGPPGTGKSMAAALLGKRTNKDVYRVDLSMVISKYIGETEKNLSSVFEKAEHKDWILFFDEADALFGKRTQQNNAHDKYANQEVSYLLQRVENYNGTVILASNMKDNIDPAFVRRFQSMIYFPVPKPGDRHKLWEQSFSRKTKFDEKIDLRAIADRYEITGGGIINVVRDCSLSAMKRGDHNILLTDLEKAIREEFAKENKSV